MKGTDPVSYTHLDTPIDSTEGKKLFVRIADELLDCELSLIHIYIAVVFRLSV